MKVLTCLDCRLNYLRQIWELRNEVDRYKVELKSYKKIEEKHRSIIKRYEDLIKASDDVEYNEISDIKDIFSDDEELEDD